MTRWLLKLLRYLWASPNTMLGLTAVFLAVCSGGKVRVVRGAIETHGGFVTRMLSGWVPWIRFASAMTLGPCDSWNEPGMSRPQPRPRTRSRSSVRAVGTANAARLPGFEFGALSAWL